MYGKLMLSMDKSLFFSSWTCNERIRIGPKFQNKRNGGDKKMESVTDLMVMVSCGG